VVWALTPLTVRERKVKAKEKKKNHQKVVFCDHTYP
jgi:hypothetical protein